MHRSEPATSQHIPMVPRAGPAPGLSGLSWTGHQVLLLRGQTQSRGPPGTEAAHGAEHAELEGERIRGSSVPTLFPEREEGRSPQSPPREPLQLSSACARSSSSLLRACPPAPLTHDSPPNPGPLSFYRHTLLTSTVMTQLMLLEGHEQVSRSS